MNIFIAYDFEIRGGLPDTIEAVAENPGMDCNVCWTGTESGRSQGELWREIVEPGIKNADQFVAYVDKPNANVGFEIGFALGLGRRVALARCCSILPDWLHLPPLHGMMCEQANGVPSLRKLLQRKAEDWACSPKTLKMGKNVLFLCPADCGSPYMDQLDSAWRILPSHGWSVMDLPR